MNIKKQESMMLCNTIILFFLLIVEESITTTTTIYHHDYEPRVFDYLPLNCYDCLSYRDIILTELLDVPARSFENFHLGTRDTFMILNGQLKLILHPYAFQSLIVQKPNKTLTITLTAPNSWLNITGNTFNGLELQSYSTLRLIIKFFYGCTFHTNSLSGIKMSPSSRLILDISSVTEVIFEDHIINENDFNSSVEFLISRTETILFQSYAFSQLNILSQESISFHFELISHIHFKSSSFQSLQLARSSSFQFYSIFLNRLTIDSYAFENLQFDSNAIFNFTIRTLGACLCFKSYSFNNLQMKIGSKNSLILFDFYTLRGLSFLANTFANLSLDNPTNQLKILANNPLNDPNPIVNFASDTFSTRNTGLITLNFSEMTLVRFEKNSLKTNDLIHQIFLKDISLVDLSTLEYYLTKKKFIWYFDNIQYVKWYQSIPEENNFNSLVQYHFNYLSNSSCLLYTASRSIPWLFLNSNFSICNCPLLYAYKHGKLDGQSIRCLHSMSGHATAREMTECDFNRQKNSCQTSLEHLFNLNTTDEHPSSELDHFFIRQLYDRNYLSCSLNYSSFPSTIIIRSRLFNHLSLVIGIIFFIFIFLLILVIALLNGLQYKMREYDETWTWRGNMSWTTLRRTLSQTSLRRSRRDLRNVNSHGITSKSDNQLDRLRHAQQDSDDPELDYDLKQSRSIQEEDLKRTIRR